MPCDTTYTTTTMDLANVNRDVLARSLKAAGWRVRHEHGSLTATKGSFGAVTLTIDAYGASLTAPSYVDQAPIRAGILAAYGRLAATETVAAFGFRPVAERTLENGAIELTFNRLGAAPLGTLGKVGL